MTNDANRQQQRAELRRETEASLRSAQQVALHANQAAHEANAHVIRLQHQLARVESAPMPPDGCPSCYVQRGLHAEVTPIESPPRVDHFRCNSCREVFAFSPYL